jgi:predicted alpha/beta-fold hydrolase
LREIQEHAISNHHISEVAPIQPQSVFLSDFRRHQSPMAGIIAVGISMGAEKLGRKISEKRLERKDKKVAAVSFDASFRMRIADL